jgi:Cd2+/Zn2+-exporting ATPase
MRPEQAEEISGKGIRAVFPEGTVLCGSRGLMEDYQIDTGRYQKDVYGTEVLIAVDGRLEGYLVIADEIKEEAGSAVSRMKSQRLLTAMLTGDAKDSAIAVAQQTGIDEVHAQLLPQDKLHNLQKIREKHGAVMFVGDGINDAPVLAGADVGAAMGSGADAAIEAADVVFMTSSVDAIPEAVDIARSTGRIAMQNVVFALTVKFLVMILGFFGYANMWMAVFADTGVAMLCVLNSIRVLYTVRKS